MKLRRDDDVEKEKVEKKMRKTIEKHNVNITLSTLIIVLIAIIGFGLTIQRWVSTVENNFVLVNKDIIANTQKNIENEKDVHILQSRDTDVRVDLAKLETQLIEIRGLLIEIKKDMRENRK